MKAMDSLLPRKCQRLLDVAHLQRDVVEAYDPRFAGFSHVISTSYMVENSIF